MAITELKSADLKVVCLADSIVEGYEDSERRGHMRLGVDDVRWLAPQPKRPVFGSSEDQEVVRDPREAVGLGRGRADRVFELPRRA